MSDVSLIDRLLDVIERDILPLTTQSVANGNKLFGAAILRKNDHSLVLAETNNETENPLWHGEVHCLKRFYELPKAEQPGTKECIFLATHEPCSLCLSAITWTGFDNFYYLFSHEDSRDSFAIPARFEDSERGLHPRSGRLQCRERLLEELFNPQAGSRTAGGRAHQAGSADRKNLGTL